MNLLYRVSGGFTKKFFVALSAVAVLAACSGKGEGVADPNNGELAVESSSSVENSRLSSSVKEKSSSSYTQGDAKQSSSSEKSGKSSSSTDDASSSSVKSESSSSVEDLQSSSSSSADEMESSSSSETLATPCKTETEDNCEYGELTDDRDGRTYKTVKIGDQEWMAENLNFDPGQGGSGENKYDWSWCYLNSAENCDVFGRSYTWAAAMDSVKTGCGKGSTCSPTLPVQGICPMGWHLPRSWEWGILFSTVGIRVAGKMLKSQTEWKNFGNGADAFGFSVLPVGDGSQDGFSSVGYEAHFWTSGENNDVFAFFISLSYDDVQAHVSNDFKHKGFSVRCLKD